MNQFDAAVRPGGDLFVVDLTGVIDGGAEQALDAAYAACGEAGAESVGLDFHAVEYINSTGIALLVSLLAKARRDARPVLAWGLTDHYREIFEITRLADFLEVVDEEPAAGSDTDTNGEG